MLLLLDSNITIATDPLGVELEPGAAATLEFLRLATTHHHDLRSHPASRLDFDRIPDSGRRAARLSLFDRYEPLSAPPDISDEQRAVLGQVTPNSNDAVDQLLLAAVLRDAVDYLVTQDEGLHRRARRLGVEDRVLLVADALSMLRTLHRAPPAPPPAVDAVKTHQLDLHDPIFDGLRTDYPGFDAWFQRTARSQRDAFLVNGADRHAAICIVKTEPAGEYGMAGPLLKLCTFKVAEGYSGQKYGELLLKAVFERANADSVKGCFVTVFDRHVALTALFEQFGFNKLPVVTPSGEHVLAKPLLSETEVDQRLRADSWPTLPSAEIDAESARTALGAHTRFGPPYLPPNATPFLVPIEPRWHRVLFPDAEPADDALLPALTGTTRPFGNALRKAYLCNAPTRLLRPGDPLLFYRSSDYKAIFVLGVCESTLVSRDPAHIATTVGQRTVYSFDQIQELADSGPVLVVLFRQDRILRDNPITLTEALAEGLVRSWPQTISRARAEGLTWLRQRLGA